MLIAEGIRVTAGGREILGGVDLRLDAGDFLAIVGPNGAGKTTLMRALAGLGRPAAGRVTLGGRPLGSYSDRERAREVAFVSQNPSLGFGFTVLDVVSMGRHPYRGRMRSLTPADREAVERAMAATGVAELAHRRVNELSGGERQRVFLARAMAQEPRLLFLDEPTANLDIRYQLEILSLVRRLNEEQGLTVVLAIHDLTWALRFCKSILVLAEGKGVAIGAAGEVVTPDLLHSVFGVRGVIRREPDRPPAVDFIGLDSTG